MTIKPWMSMLLIVASGIFVYWFSLHAPFTFDDYPHLVDNQRLQQATTLNEMLHSGFQETRPLFGLSMALSFKLFGLQPFYYHLISLILHLATALLAFNLLSLLGKLRGLALAPKATLFVVLLFTLHPLQTESVSYSNSRSGLLMGFFLFASCWAFCKSRLASSPMAKIYFFLLTLVSAILSMLAKEAGAVIPLLILWMDLYLIPADARSLPRRKIVTQHLLIWLTTLTVPILFMVFKNPHQGTIGFAIGDKIQYALTQVNVLGYFVKSFLVPVSQNLDYDFPLLQTVWNGQFIVSSLLLACMMGLAWLWRQQRPLIAFGIFWFFASIAPTNSIIPFKDFIAERHLYVPLFGLALAVVVSLQHFAVTKPRLQTFSMLLFALWLIFLTQLTMQRNKLWSSEVALWADTVAKSPAKARPLFNLGAALADQKRYAEAETVLLQALQIAPNDAPTLFNLGMIYKQQGRCAEAIPLLQRSLQFRPQHAMTQRVLDKCLGKT